MFTDIFESVTMQVKFMLESSSQGIFWPASIWCHCILRLPCWLIFFLPNISRLVQSLCKYKLNFWIYLNSICYWFQTLLKYEIKFLAVLLGRKIILKKLLLTKLFTREIISYSLFFLFIWLPISYSVLSNCELILLF